ncbi:hypothetical protein FK220_010300 [Flavobacteriaceae bacterium TP-CH-4]|uniref:Uncharacterized protein n=1 Tax=Pelagihabitans pacificus TaxID=2696054 RepID=A0A967E705_9FLAO|nr:hypothetical protein [Pelagihabitans pacificus]NHF59734.1 hypothetical protein [Pelagihabitans pacificus]
MNTSEIHPLPKETFESLMKRRALHCVSIYLPMDKQGKEQNRHLAQARLKQCINEVKRALAEHQMHEDQITTYLQPIEQLLHQVTLWRNPSDGLVIFLDPEEGMRYFQIPIPFEVQTYVAGHFYLLPLLPLYHGDGQYYVLELSQDYVRLYKASRYGFEDQNIEDFAPHRLEEAVGYDYAPKMFQFRSGQNVHSAGSFHGHGEGKDDRKKELITFFREIDKGVKKVVSGQNIPLVLACVDEVYDVYKEASTYPALFDKNLEGDPEFKGKTSLHQASWDLIEPYFKQIQEEKRTKFTESYHTPKTSYEIDSIIKAALNGKVDTLFIQKGTEVYGIYDRENDVVALDTKKDTNNASLTNLTALETYRQGGAVYILPSTEMPIKERVMNALFRY